MRKLWAKISNTISPFMWVKYMLCLLAAATKDAREVCLIKEGRMKVYRMDIYKQGIVFESTRSVINLHWKHIITPKYWKSIFIILTEHKPEIIVPL